MSAPAGRRDSSKTIAACWDLVVNAANTIMSTRAAHRAGDAAVRTPTWGSADRRTLRPFPRAQSAAAVTRWLAAPKPPKTATAEARHPSYQPLAVQFGTAAAAAAVDLPRRTGVVGTDGVVRPPCRKAEPGHAAVSKPRLCRKSAAVVQEVIVGAGSSAVVGVKHVGAVGRIVAEPEVVVEPTALDAVEQGAWDAQGALHRGQCYGSTKPSVGGVVPEV